MCFDQYAMENVVHVQTVCSRFLILEYLFFYPQGIRHQCKAIFDSIIGIDKQLQSSGMQVCLYMPCYFLLL